MVFKREQSVGFILIHNIYLLLNLATCKSLSIRPWVVHLPVKGTQFCELPGLHALIICENHIDTNMEMSLCFVLLLINFIWLFHANAVIVCFYLLIFMCTTTTLSLYLWIHFTIHILPSRPCRLIVSGNSTFWLSAFIYCPPFSQSLKADHWAHHCDFSWVPENGNRM